MSVSRDNLYAKATWLIRLVRFNEQSQVAESVYNVPRDANKK